MKLVEIIHKEEINKNLLTYGGKTNCGKNERINRDTKQ